MEGNLNGTLEKTEKVEEESLSEDKDVAVEVSADDDFDGKSKSQSDTKDDVDVDVDIDEHVDSDKVVEETENVSETVAESSDAIEANQVENIVASEEDEELELKEEKGENFEVEQTELATSKDNNEVVETDNNEVVETVKDMTVDEEENVLSSTDVVSISREVVLETSDPKSDYEVEKVVPPKGIEEQLDVQESSSYESAKESLQPSSNVVDSESNSVTEQDKIEESKGIENQGSIFVVTQRQQTSWKSCCGLFEILGH
ncbi:hypothetical protein L195_g047618, partial [Trifolium pratense]